MLNKIISTHFMHVEAELINSDFFSKQNIENCFNSIKPSKNEVVLANFNILKMGDMRFVFFPL